MTGRRGLAGVVGRLPMTQAALAYAARLHAGQRRSSDGGPFIEHPLEVGCLLYGAGAADRVIAAGLLHDVLEKTEVSAADLRTRFGPAVAKLVQAVSEDETIAGYGQRKAALRKQAAAAGPDALMIFAADKVSKVRELRAAVSARAQRHERVGESLLPPRRLEHFRHCLRMLEEGLPGSSLVAQFRTELFGLNRELGASPEAAAA